MDMKKMCCNCNKELTFLSQEKIQLGQVGFFTGTLSNLIDGALEVNIFICNQCRKVEFYALENQIEEDLISKINCPNCNFRHDMDYPKCPQCKYRYV